MGNIVRVPQDYASNNTYSKVKEAAQFIGEEMIGLVMFRVGLDDRGPDARPRCVCFNEVYTDTQEYACPYCFGSTFAGGVKEVWRMWSIWNDDEAPVERAQFGGIWYPKSFTVQTEPWPAFYETDYLLRVARWDTGKQSPLTLEFFYQINRAHQKSIRTGNRHGNSESDQIAQVLECTLLPRTHAIYKYDVVENVEFPRRDGQPR